MMRWASNPHVTIDRVSGFIRIHVRPQLGLSFFLGGALMAGWIASLAKIWKHGWSGDLFTTFYWTFFGAIGFWNMLRGVLSEETIEISHEKIFIHRSFLFGGNREFPCSEISGFGIAESGEDHGGTRHFRFQYKVLPVTFAHNISEPDSKLVLEAVGSIGGIGRESKTDPFGKDSSLVLLNLNSSR